MKLEHEARAVVSPSPILMKPSPSSASTEVEGSLQETTVAVGGDPTEESNPREARLGHIFGKCLLIYVMLRS